MNVDKLVWGAVLVLTLCRFVLTSQSELSPQESLWWMESQRLTWAYLDDGPIVPLLVRASTSVFGATALGVRFWNPFLILLSTYWLFLLARSVCNRITARWTVVIFSLLPMVNFAAIRHADVAAVLCFAILTLWLLWCGLHRAKPWHWTWWLAGWALALCLLTNLMLALFALTPVLIVAIIPRWRGQWTRPGIYVMLGVGLSLTLACVMRFGGWRFLVLYLQHHWQDLGLHPLNAATTFGGFVMFTGPLVVLGWIWLHRRWQHAWADYGMQFLTVATISPLICATIIRLFLGQDVTYWWFGAAPGAVLLIHVWMQSDLAIPTKAFWRRALLVSTTVITLIGLNSDNVRAMGIPWPYAWDASQDRYGWAKSALAIESTLRQSHERQGVPQYVITDSWEAAAAIDFHMNNTAPILRPHPNYPRIHVPESSGLQHQFHLWPNYSHEYEGAHPFRGQTALYITQSEDRELPSHIRHAFKSTELAAVLVVKRRNQSVRRWFFHHCYRYNGLPL